jgi:serine/threonine protein kinase
MVDQLTSSQILEFQRVLSECDGYSTEAERNRRLSELEDPAICELLQAAFEEPASARNLPPRFRLDIYELTEQLGGGGFGDVWRARGLGAEAKDVAIKVIRSEHLHGEATGKFVQLFRDEIEHHKDLVHDGIVKLMSAGSVVLPGCVEAIPFLVMELCDGLRLPDACRGRTIEEKVQCMIRICQAVQHAHRSGLMHLDLKPENILVADTGGKLWPKILDFGLARRFRAERPFDSTRFGAGTLPYKAPEQIDSSLGGEDYRTDVHALGVILFQVLTDHLPYPVEEGTTAEYKKFILDGPRLGLDAFDKSIDIKLQKICARAMAIERAQRYDSPTRLAEALERWLRSHAARSRNRFLLAVSVVACLAIAVAVAVRKPKSGIRWRPVPIIVQGHEQPFATDWRDILWTSESDGWLCGGDEQPIAGKFVGPGFLLHTSDGGQLWQEFAASNFTTDSGTLTRFEGKTWNGIGPIRFVDVRMETQADGQRLTNGWIAGITGVYFSSEPGNVNGKWTRITPSPEGAEGYSYFEGLMGLSDYQETLAFGWQGIAHSEGGGPWEVQLTTINYCVSSITCVDAENKDFWAVTSGGGGGPSERGRPTDFGAVYHHDGTGTNWELVPLPGISLKPGQILYDIMPWEAQELFVVGSSGLILRGSGEGTNRVWKKLRSNTRWHLSSVCVDIEDNLWVVGNQGTILRSADGGESWVEYPCFDEQGKRIREAFHRIRFFGKRGWIVGDTRVLRCELPEQSVKND